MTLGRDQNLNLATHRLMVLQRFSGTLCVDELHLGVYTLLLATDPLADLREALPGLFVLGESPSGEQLAEWLPDRWLLHRARASPGGQAAAG